MVGRRLLRTFVHGLGILAGLIILALLGLAWRLHDGPIVLGEATPWVMGMLEESVPGFSIQVSDAALAGGDWRTTYGLTLSDVRILDEDGEVVFESREIDVDMYLPALIKAELRPVGITIAGARIRLVREAGGHIRYTLADSPAPESTEQPDTGPDGSLLDWFLHAGSTPPLDRLDRISFVQADVFLEDQETGLAWDAPDSFLVIARDDVSLGVDIETVLISDSRLLPLEFAAHHQHGSSRIDVSGEVLNIDLASLPDAVPALGRLLRFDLAS